MDSAYYTPILSGVALDSVRWRAMALPNLTPRLARTMGPFAEDIIYTDAATTTQIIATVIMDPRTFRAGRALSAVFYRRVGPQWRDLLGATCEIYGLEMLAIFAALSLRPLCGPIRA